MKQIFDLCSSREIPGKDKKAWTKHGILLIGEDGRMSVKLESVPVGEFNGWFSVFEQKRRDGSATGSEGMGDDPVPF